MHNFLSKLRNRALCLPAESGEALVRKQGVRLEKTANSFLCAFDLSGVTQSR